MTSELEDVGPHALLLFLESLYHAVILRDERRIRSLLSRPYATHLPREVREEALAHASLPSASLRAPIKLLRFRHRMSQLVHQDPLYVDAQLELPLDAPDSGVVRLAVTGRAAARSNEDDDDA